MRILNYSTVNVRRGMYQLAVAWSIKTVKTLLGVLPAGTGVVGLGNLESAGLALRREG